MNFFWKSMIIIVSIIVPTLANNGREQFPFLSREQAQEDFRLCIGSVDTFFLFKFSLLSQEEYNSLSNELLNTPLNDSVSIIKVYQAINNYVRGFNCGHAIVHRPIPDNNRKTKYIPLKLISFDSSIAVVGASRRSRIPTGSQILSINSLTAPEINSLSSDAGVGKTDEWRRIVGLLGFHSHYIDEYGFQSEYKVDYIPPFEDSIQTVTISAQKQRKVYQRVWDYLDYGVSLELDSISNSGIIGFSHFMRPENIDVYLSEITTILDEITEEGCDNIVFDLRKNTGGFPSAYLHLLYAIVDKPTVDLTLNRLVTSEIKSYVSNNSQVEFCEDAVIGDEAIGDTIISSLNDQYRDMYRHNALRNKKIFVFVDRYSYSAATMFAYYLQKNGAATVIGEKSNQPFPFEASPLTITLPNSGITMKIPHRTFSFTNMTNESERYFLTPDHLVRETYDDFLNRKDIMLEKLQELTK